jgi:hypothetical protein
VVFRTPDPGWYPFGTFAALTRTDLPQSEVASRICMNVDTSPSAQDDCRQSWERPVGPSLATSRRSGSERFKLAGLRRIQDSLPGVRQARKLSRHILQRGGVVALERRYSMGLVRCLLELYRSGGPGASRIYETVAALRGALAAPGGGYPLARTYRNLDLADALWQHGEREESARHASDALVLAAGMEWRGARERLEDVHRRMEGDPLPAARDFGERFRTLVWS